MKAKQIWFITGSQHLYGPETLKQVAANAETIARALNADASIPVEIVFKPIVTTPDEIRTSCSAASNDASCVGVITWMHTFSPPRRGFKPAAHTTPLSASMSARSRSRCWPKWLASSVSLSTMPPRCAL